MRRQAPVDVQVVLAKPNIVVVHPVVPQPKPRKVLALLVDGSLRLLLISIESVMKHLVGRHRVE